MKRIFLSFRPEYFRPLLYGIKKYEYRKRFCDEETIAYLYLSGKSRQVVGIMELGKPIRLDITRDNYLDYPNTLKRVDEYIKSKDINAIPIKSLSLFKNPLTLEDIRKEIPSFMPPQMYFVLDNHLKLKKLLEKQKVCERLFYHEHNCIYYDNLAKSVSELKKTKEYIDLEKVNANNNSFSNISFLNHNKQK